MPKVRPLASAENTRPKLQLLSSMIAYVHDHATCEDSTGFHTASQELTSAHCSLSDHALILNSPLLSIQNPYSAN